MKYVHCPHCPRKFGPATPGSGALGLGRLKANLANHMKGAHPEHYVPKKQPPTVGLGPPIPKRPYTKKPKQTETVSYCPACGCNIRAVRVAMGL